MGSFCSGALRIICCLHSERQRNTQSLSQVRSWPCTNMCIHTIELQTAMMFHHSSQFANTVFTHLTMILQHVGYPTIVSL